MKTSLLFYVILAAFAMFLSACSTNPPSGGLDAGGPAAGSVSGTR